jgi:hypothetical protein
MSVFFAGYQAALDIFNQQASAGASVDELLTLCTQVAKRDDIQELDKTAHLQQMSPEDFAGRMGIESAALDMLKLASELSATRGWDGQNDVAILLSKMELAKNASFGMRAIHGTQVVGGTLGMMGGAAQTAAGVGFGNPLLAGAGVINMVTGYGAMRYGADGWKKIDEDDAAQNDLRLRMLRLRKKR